MLIYGTLFISECLGKVKPGMTSREAEKVLLRQESFLKGLLMDIYQALINVSLDHFAIPGDVAFPLNQAFEPPRDRQDAETLRQYVPIPLSSFRR
jgi:actin related protein 2/3 complex subunit 3